ncbi:MAG: 23S rRNA (pseudouridine(1915)-N(3))-methyltransferase RlmH [Finegoldia sp.]|nr:23S rRNA (pseudouridine(1915)-N(3))-methyltransferase RlmH [Finegoldia sp.]
MNIDIICVGKLKEKYIRLGIEEFSKRLSAHCKLSIVEVADEKAPETLSESDKEIVKEREGERILAKIKDSHYVISLEIGGKNLSSEEFSKKIEELQVQGHSNLAFVIGGSLGLSKEVLKRSDYSLSFSKMTFPHQLMRLILLEQIYRAFRIMNNLPYHK